MNLNDEIWVYTPGGGGYGEIWFYQSDNATIIGISPNLSLPFKSFNSITNTKPTVFPFAFSTNSSAALAVPPVALIQKKYYLTNHHKLEFLILP